MLGILLSCSGLQPLLTFSNINITLHHPLRHPLEISTKIHSIYFSFLANFLTFPRGWPYISINLETKKKFITMEPSFKKNLDIYCLQRDTPPVPSCIALDSPTSRREFLVKKKPNTSTHFPVEQFALIPLKKMIKLEQGISITEARVIES